MKILIYGLSLEKSASASHIKLDYTIELYVLSIYFCLMHGVTSLLRTQANEKYKK